MKKVHNTMDEASSLVTQLYETHVHFVLNQCKGEALSEHIRDEIQALRVWLNQVTLNQLIKKQDLLSSIKKSLVDYPLDGESIAMHRHALILDIEKALLHAPVNQQTHLENVFSEQNHHQLTEKMIDLSRLREALVKASLNSSIYVDLVSDVLYNGIKDFLLEENFLSKMPGVSTVLKMSKWSLNKALPNMDTFVEKTAKDFIKQHIPKTVELSEKILNKSLTGDSIRQVADHIWQQIKDQPLAQANDYITDKDLVDFVNLSESWWFHYRKSEHFIESCSTFIDYWLERQGDRTPISFFDSLGGDVELLISELQNYAAHWVNLAQEQGYLEQRVRSWLAPFYESSAVAKLMLESA